MCTTAFLGILEDANEIPFLIHDKIKIKKVPRSELLFYVPLVALTAVCVSIAVQTKNAKQDENVVWLRKKMLLTYSFNFTMFSSNQSNRRPGILSLKNKFNSSHKIQDLLDGLWCDTSAVLKLHAFRFGTKCPCRMQKHNRCCLLQRRLFHFWQTCVHVLRCELLALR